MLAPDNSGGEGWRLLAAVPGGEPEQAVAVTSPHELNTLTETLDRSWSAQVDWQQEIVLAFTAVASSGLLGCEQVGFAGLVIEGDMVAGTYRRPPVKLGCNDDALLTTFLVLVDRDALPANGFTLRFTPQSPTATPVDLS